MNSKDKKIENSNLEDDSYEKLIKEMLDVIKEKSDDRESSIKDSIIQILNTFQE